MLKNISNIVDYFKYGKVVHRCPSGRVIRKKTQTSSMVSHIFDTTSKKTILNPERKVEQTIERTAFVTQEGDKFLYRSRTISQNYDPQTGKTLKGRANKKHKRYTIEEFFKTIVDYSKPKTKYNTVILPDGRTQYNINFSETTTISKLDNQVKTSYNVVTKTI